VLEFGPNIGSGEHPVFLDVDHVYTLSAASDNDGPYFGNGTNGARLTIFATPESEGTSTFLFLGLLATAAFNLRTGRFSGRNFQSRK
jgi:hypothetical protein